MINRTLQSSIGESLKKFPVVGIVGSRQTGKTTLAKMVRQAIKTKSVYLDLELPSDLNKLQSPELYPRQFSDWLVIIDENTADAFPVSAHARIGGPEEVRRTFPYPRLGIS